MPVSPLKKWNYKSKERILNSIFLMITLNFVSFIQRFFEKLIGQFSYSTAALPHVHTVSAIGISMTILG